MATDKEKCLGVGMDGYLTKPINVPLLVSTIKSFVKRGAAAGRTTNSTAAAGQ